MRANRNWLERIVFTGSTLLVVAVLGLLAVDAWSGKDSPPDLSIHLGTPLKGAHGWRVPVRVMNQGDETAEQVRVAVVWTQGGQVQERAELQLDYVPRHSRRNGWVSFTQEPRPAELKAHSLGYATP